MSSSFRLWLFRILVLIATILVVVSWFMPWWTMDVEAISITNAIVVHPYGFENNLGGYAYYLPVEVMPVWFTPLMWVLLGVAILCLLSAFWFQDKKIKVFGRYFNLSSFLTICMGISYILVVVAAFIVLNIQTKIFGGEYFELVGENFISMGGFEESYCYSRFGFGWWLACAIGPILIILALLRNKIIGKNN